MIESDVVVVGAGPVGLWAACEVRLTGARVVLLERRPDRTKLSRALTIHGRTLETFALRGLVDRFMSRGRVLPTGHFAGLDTRLDFSVFATAHPHTLFLPQEATEETLEDRARELGVDIRRGYVVDSVEQLDDSVTITGQSPEGVFALTASYVVGADGARSTVRERVGIEFDGLDASLSVMMGDVVVDLPPGAPFAAAINERGSAQVLPLGDGVHHRVILFDPSARDVDKSEALTLEQLSASLTAVFGTDFGVRSPFWLTRFGDETRLARSYRAGRVFLAGDAAHIHAPMGGVGMNVGIQDAMNLGWKLGGVATGTLPDEILDSYDAERRPVGERLFTNTLAQARLATSVDAPGLAVRTIVSELLQNPQVNRDLAGELSGFGLTYGPELFDALALPLVGGFDSVAAERVPDEVLHLVDGDASLHSALAEGEWVLLADAGAVGGSLALPDFLANSAVRMLQLSETAAALGGAAAVLIRPDGYLFARAPHNN